MDTTPGIATLNRIVYDNGGEILRKFSVTAVDANTGDFVAMTNEDTPIEDLA